MVSVFGRSSAPCTMICRTPTDEVRRLDSRPSSNRSTSMLYDSGLTKPCATSAMEDCTDDQPEISADHTERLTIGPHSW